MDNLPKSLRISPGYVLAIPIENEEHDSLSLQAPKEDKPQKAKVIAIGDKTYYNSGHELTAPCEVDEVVWHSAYNYEDFNYKGDKYRFIPFQQIRANYK